jgi:hypothetical protein
LIAVDRVDAVHRFALRAVFAPTRFAGERGAEPHGGALIAN